MGEKFIIGATANIFKEIDESFNFELVKALRSGKDHKEVLKKDAEWLKAVLPEYIDAEVSKLINALGIESD